MTTEKINIVNHNVSILKLRSGPVLNIKESLRPTARPLLKSVFQRIEPPEKMVDLEKRNISCFLRNVDKGNSFVLKVELIPFFRAFACLETS